jgi:hypothetical protein
MRTTPLVLLVAHPLSAINLLQRPVHSLDAWLLSFLLSTSPGLGRICANGCAPENKKTPLLCGV